MGIRRVRHGQFMLCRKCGLVFLVSDLVGGAEVFHDGHEEPLQLLLSVDEHDEAVLSMVEFVRERNRLEVRPGLGVV